jgi:alpha-glucosidase (family GH31 glycosyl hydrolase)
MTWDRKFDGVYEFLDIIKDKGRNLVVIIDPHIKIDRNYFIYNDAIENGNFKLTQTI